MLKKVFKIMTEKKILYFLMTIVFTIKFFLIEYYYFINQLSNQFTLSEYMYYQIPVYLIYKVTLILIVVSWGYLLDIKKGLTYIASINFLNSVFSLAVALYIKAFDKLPSFSSIYSVSGIGELWSSIGFMLEPHYLFLFFDCIFMFYIAIKIKKKKNSINTTKVFITYLVVGVMIVLLLPSQLESYIEELGEPAYHFYHKDSLMAIEHHSYIPYGIIEIINGLNRSDYIELSQEQAGNINEWFDTRNRIINKENRGKLGASKGKNIILIQIESLETQLIDRKVENKEIMPFLNSIKNESIFFPNIYEQVGEGNSSDTEFMINTSLYPVRNGIAFYQFAGRNFENSFPNILKTEGYYSIVAHGDRKTFWNRSNVYPGMGYNEFWGIEDYDQGELIETASIIGLGLSDESFFRQSTEKILELKEPYMASLITLTTHSPFRLPESEINISFPEIEDNSVRDYVESFSYMDKVLENFFVDMEKKGLLENALVVIYGDHEGLNKYYEPEEQWQNEKLLPLIIYGSNLESKTYNTIGGEIDIMPTILELIGVEVDSYKLMGNSLFNKGEGYVLTSSGMISGYVDSRLIEIEKKGYEISELILKSQKSFGIKKDTLPIEAKVFDTVW